MPRKEYSFEEIRGPAEDLYVEDGKNYEQVVAILRHTTGVKVALNTVKAWAGQGGWRGLRKRKIENRRTLKRSLDDLREKMMNEAITHADPQNIHAVTALEKLALQLREKPEEKAPDIDRPRIFLEDMEFVAETLKEIDPEGLRVLARNFETIINRFKISATDAQRRR